MLPKLFTKKFLGIDIGTSSIRIAEIERSGQKISLANYGQIDLSQIETDVPKTEGRAISAFSADDVAEMIQAILASAKIRTRQCAFSIPDFSTFFTSFSLPPMTPKELPKAVMFEARQHIPLPMDSVAVDWQLIGGASRDPDQKMDVTVTAIPNEIIAYYREIALKAKLEVILMEAEMFGLARALVSAGEARPVCLIDMGIQSTVCSLVEKGVLRYAHSFDRGGKYLVDEFTSRLPIGAELARSIRENFGLREVFEADAEIKGKLKEILKESLMPILREVEVMLSDYRRASNSDVAAIILSGGVMLLPDVEKIFADYFKIETGIANPFEQVDCQREIVSGQRELGLDYSVAIGMAERANDLAK